jgi:hypothetical protein
MDERILLHLRGDCVVKIAPKQAGVGVFSGVSHIFGNRYLVASFHGFYKLTQIFCFLYASQLLLQF